MSTERALSFGPIASSYERFRPEYPEEVYAAVARYAGRPIRAALEIGAGTGKATRLFARHGIEVTATEPDPAMLAELRTAVTGNVRPVQAAFEDLAASGPGRGGEYGLVYAAASLHWTRPEGRWPLVASLLAPGGVFACFGGPFQLADAEVEQAVSAARAPFLGSDEVPAPDGTAPDAEMRWPGTELQRSGMFEDVRQIVIERRPRLTAEDYIGYLSTVSAYLQLAANVREQAFAAIAKALPDHVEINADVWGNLARRVGDAES